MTFSIVARCPRTGQLGAAAATGMPGVGKLVTWVRVGAGAVATQAWINPYLGIDGLRLLEEGRSAPEALEAVLAKDVDREIRQVGIVDDRGGAAAWTGTFCRLDSVACEGASADQTGDGYSVQGNLLHSAETIRACADAFEEAVQRPLVERLLHALEAGEAAGGDRRGSRSATLHVVDSEEYPLWDIRVDEDPRPLAELRRLYRVFAEDLIAQVRELPTRSDVHGGLSSDDLVGFA